MDTPGSTQRGNSLHCMPGEEPDMRRPPEKMLWAARVLPVLAVLVLIRACWPDPKDEPGSTAAMAARLRVAATVIGEYIADECPQSKVLILMPPPGWDGHSQHLERALKWGVNDGLGEHGKVLSVAFPEFPEGVRDQMSQKTGRDMSTWHPPVGDWFTFPVLQDVLGRFPEADVVVSAIGLPQDCAKLFTEDWQPSLAPTFFILAGPLPRADFLELAMAKGVVAAAVAPQRVTLRTVPAGIPAKLSDAFGKRFCFVCPDTIGPLAYDYPDLFGDFPDVELPKGE